MSLTRCPNWSGTPPYRAIAVDAEAKRFERHTTSTPEDKGVTGGCVGDDNAGCTAEHNIVPDVKNSPNLNVLVPKTADRDGDRSWT